VKKLICFLIFAANIISAKAQSSCQEIMEYVKSENSGTTYINYTSTAINKVTFYDITIDYKYYYFAIVCFKQEYSYTCSEYIYQVDSNTKFNYSLHYLESAGEAFWKFIHPYNKNLNCAPTFE